MKTAPWTVVLLLRTVMTAHGYDAYTSCPRQLRTSKSWPEPPCDFRSQSWCSVPGSAYPWYAVRRFVRENQGLMRRMYGDQRHISVLRAEIESNDVEEHHRDEVRQRYAGGHVTPPATTTTVPGVLPRAPPPSFVPKAKNFTKEGSDLPDPTLNSTLGKLSAASLATTTVAAPTPPPPTTTEPTTMTTDTATITPGPTEVGELGTEPVTTEEPPQRKTVPTLFKEKPGPAMLFQAEAEERMPAIKVPVKLKGVNACPVKEEVVAPFWANNTRGEILALLNLYPFEQYVHWEKCTFEHKQMYCREGCRCEQQYRLHRLLAYDPKNECRGIFSDWFKFPSCCVCKCYDLPVEFHITSRSPRARHPHHWYRAANAR